MSIFRTQGEELDEKLEELERLEARRLARKKIRDLLPEFRQKRKEPAKPWGKKERIFVLIALAGTVLASGFLAASARNFKLPGLPRISLSSSLSLRNLFKEETITIGKKSPELLRQKRAEEITTAFKEKTKNYSGVYTLYVIDLKSGFAFGVAENEVMRAASLIKLPVMLYAQGKVEEAKIEAMGKRSDNGVFRELRRKFGDTELQNHIASLGMEKTSLAENQTTPKEIGNLLAKIYQEKNEKILNYLTDTIFENWLRAGIPQEIRIAHKYGREVHAVNDAGIVYAEHPFVLVIMSDGVIEKEADTIFPELAKLVYLGMGSGF